MSIPKKTHECPGCLGTGIQLSIKTGLRVLCPICNGTGEKPEPVTQNIKWTIICTA